MMANTAYFCFTSEQKNAYQKSNFRCCHSPLDHTPTVDRGDWATSRHGDCVTILWGACAMDSGDDHCAGYDDFQSLASFP
jgi:hypothetical protein